MSNTTRVIGLYFLARQITQWIRKLKYQINDVELSRTCYLGRGNQISKISQFSRQPLDCYAELAHYVGRLGAHVYAVKMMLYAALKVPAVKNIKDVQFESAPSVEDIEIPEGAVAYEILREICTSRKLHPAEMKKYLVAFAELDADKGISDKLATKRSLCTRIHCELQLCDLFSRAGWEFADGDKYIGCSKAACYFCAQYISLHHKGFVVPPTHNKVVVGVRPPKPDPQRDINGNGAKKMKEMEGKMTWKIENDFLEALVRERPAIQFQHCSTNGSSRAPSVSTVGQRTNYMF